MERSHIDESLGEGDEKVTGYRKPLKLWRPMEREHNRDIALNDQLSTTNFLRNQ